MNQFKTLLITALVSTSGVSLAGEKKSEQKPLNCDVSGKKIHVKDKAHCDSSKGVFIDVKQAASTTEVKPAEKKADAKVEALVEPAKK